MAYTARQLITRSWYLSGIVARNLQDVTGDQATDGLALLNSLLDFKQIEIEYIPYKTYNTSITCVPGQEVYFIPNCAQIESVTFNLDVLRYPMDYVSQDNYFGSGRVDNISSLPFSYTFLREKGGGNLYMYFLPQQNFPLKILGKFFLADVTLDTDLSLTLDTSYIEFLRYSLASYMCSEYGVSFNPESQNILMSYKRKLMYMSPPDLSMRKSTILSELPGFNYGDVNLGRGWRVP
jgi:hypothetical protein